MAVELNTSLKLVLATFNAHLREYQPHFRDARIVVNQSSREFLAVFPTNDYTHGEFVQHAGAYTVEDGGRVINLFVNDAPSASRPKYVALVALHFPHDDGSF